MKQIKEEDLDILKWARNSFFNQSDITIANQRARITSITTDIIEPDTLRIMLEIKPLKE